MDKDSCFDNVDVSKGSSAPMDQALAHSHETMVKINTGCTTNASVEIVRPCNIISSRNWIKHSPPSFGSSQQIHTLGNGISPGG